MTDNSSDPSLVVAGREIAPGDIRVRFCPSPTGNPHVGMVRTALFNWAFARHHGGTFVFRIEDTDAARDSEESYEALLDAMSWLGLTWDEGPLIGGPHEPYRQSQRSEIYAKVAGQLTEAGFAYPCFCTPAELEERRTAAMAAGKPPGYDGHCRNLTADEQAAERQAGKSSALRFKMPETDAVWDDLVRGEIRFGAEHTPDFVFQRADGNPLYTLVNPVDDALMGITHVLRGEDLLSSTPRQLAMYEGLKAIGVATLTPRFGHLPYVMGEGNRKLSKRDPQSSLNMYRQKGYLPEGLINYLALLGWSIGDDREFFSKDEMAEAFQISRVNPNPARFDLKKCTAINGDWVRALSEEQLVERLVPYLAQAGLVSENPSPDQLATLAAVLPLIHTRMDTLDQAAGMIEFLFRSDGEFQIDDADREKVLKADAVPVLNAARDSLAGLEEWNHEQIEVALRASLIEGLSLKPKVAFGPVRVAATGRRISPPLFESLELLGKESSLLRITAAIQKCGLR